MARTPVTGQPVTTLQTPYTRTKQYSESSRPPCTSIRGVLYYYGDVHLYDDGKRRKGPRLCKRGASLAPLPQVVFRSLGHPASSAEDAQPFERVCWGRWGLPGPSGDIPPANPPCALGCTVPVAVCYLFLHRTVSRSVVHGFKMFFCNCYLLLKCFF